MITFRRLQSPMPSNSIDPEVDFTSTVRHLCASCLTSMHEYVRLSSVSVAGKYFQIAAFAMLIYDHSRSFYKNLVY